MNATLVATVGLLVVTFSIRKAGAQETTELASSPVKRVEQWGYLCATNEKTEAAERATLEKYSSPALDKALLSGKSFWVYITDPATPYLDRMAAANRGGSVLSPEELPLLWQAMAEVGAVPSGVAPSPCSAIMHVALPLTIDALEPGSNRPRPRTIQVVLGRETQLPTKSIDFPVTVEERDHSPWLWQMERALSMLFTKTNSYYGDPSRYPARVKAAWDWPIPVLTYRPGDVVRNFAGDFVHNLDPVEWRLEWSRISIRSQALTEGAPHDPLLLETILKLALNNDNYNVAYSAGVDYLYAWGQDSYHFEELAHVAQIAILQKTQWENVAAQTAFVTASLARDTGYSANTPHIKPLKTATAVLAIGRWAVDKKLNSWNRYYSFVVPICRIVDDAPFPPDQLRDPKDPQLDEKLRIFEAWFEKKKPALEQQAEAELPHLRSLAKELSTDIE
jgi:hypothetical protein